MAIALKGVLSLILLVVILASSWLVAVLLDYYTGHGKPLKPHKRTNAAPFPNGKLENIFWFVQVRTYVVELASCDYLWRRFISGPVFLTTFFEAKLAFAVVV